MSYCLLSPVAGGWGLPVVRTYSAGQFEKTRIKENGRLVRLGALSQEDREKRGYFSYSEESQDHHRYDYPDPPAITFNGNGVMVRYPTKVEKELPPTPKSPEERLGLLEETLPPLAESLSDHEDRLGVAESAVGELQGQTGALAAGKATSASVAALRARIEALEARVQELTPKPGGA